MHQTLLLFKSSQKTHQKNNSESPTKLICLQQVIINLKYETNKITNKFDIVI